MTAPRKPAVDSNPTMPNRPGAQPPPWLLQAHYAGLIDLRQELAARYPNLPLLSVIRTRKLEALSQRANAYLSAQDGSSGILIEADARAGMQVTYSFGSMLGLRFFLDDTSVIDRARWLDVLRSPNGGLAFLWGQQRWERDYVIGIAHKSFGYLYAFSHRGFEAAARLTPEVTANLLNWLESIWPDEESTGGTGPLKASW